jgi:hypothetical protein
LGLTGLTRPTESKSIGRPLILRSLRLQMNFFFFFFFPWSTSPWSPTMSLWLLCARPLQDYFPSMLVCFKTSCPDPRSQPGMV